MKNIYILFVLLLLGNWSVAQTTVSIYDQSVSVVVSSAEQSESNGKMKLPKKDDQLLLKVSFRLSDSKLYSGSTVEFLNDKKEVVQIYNDIKMLNDGRSYSYNADKITKDVRYNLINLEYPVSEKQLEQIKFVRIGATNKSTNENVSVLITL